ncbi:peptide-methionine (R)-S-oxide reductase MsrB [Lutibacter sp. TH_r2]|uniref:peptide-methionine (R)-S-oxide reductase MsrB n=1 Tax=Lutibacter sp. TH_r2 TaxID=3082083 RepID=UPI002953058B|nr:peptide-methionine (R)-S-oxide reductase MsrB [Lutibacter sp. TH_r2]MDV7188243.1 peptide-methionine (R)-S-oxide reductase MsrB [Lutibacter sp. TH_r2]
MKLFKTLIIVTLLSTSVFSQQKKNPIMIKKVEKSEAEWKKELTPQEYFVLRQKGTDAPGEHGYTNHFEKGTYLCGACGLQLFKSGSKYESHCGWPSFDDAIEGTVNYIRDISHGMIRTEIVCASCDSHLGHIFDDGPKDTTGKRYCVNTSSIKFIKAKN